MRCIMKPRSMLTPADALKGGILAAAVLINGVLLVSESMGDAPSASVAAMPDAAVPATGPLAQTRAWILRVVSCERVEPLKTSV
jgi:hypothetical protein